MKKLLLLHYHCDYSSNDIWRAAVRNGYATERIHDASIGERSKNFDFVRYYGNTLQVERVGDKFPFNFYKMDPTILTKTPLTKRKVELMQFRHLPQPMSERKFVKPFYQKYFPAKVYEIGQYIDFAQLSDDLIYMQEPINIIDEVRCFCLNGEVLTASYYHKDKKFELENIDNNIPNEIRSMVKELYKNFNFAPGCVLDFGTTDKGEWIFIEPNEAWASGVYNCNPDKCLEVIVNSHYDKK
jgi:hypothetical protein